MQPLAIDHHHPPTPDGWTLHLKRTRVAERLDEGARPVLIVPGYGMNGFIFGFHPRGTSLERHLAEAGFEVWCANLRTQGASRTAHRDPAPPALRTLAEIDVRVAIDTVLARTETRARDVTLFGASLGGSIAYAHLALVPEPRVGALVTVGSPLRWTEIPKVLTPFRSTLLASMVRPRGTRRVASAVLPLLARAPGILSVYMNTAHVDLSRASEMAQTVEDAHPRTNRDISRWLAARDMILRGVNVTEALARTTLPLMLVVANRDGIVPVSTALAAREAWGGDDVEVLRVGDDADWYAHADLFVGDEAPTRVFEPIVRWLRAHR